MRVEEYMKAGGGRVAKVHDLCTIHYYSDSEPAQVVQVSPSGKTIFIRVLKTEVDPKKEAYIGHQNWVWNEDEFVHVNGGQLAKEPDNFSFFKATLRKDGCYRTSGSNLFVTIGVAHKYYCWEM